jgi:hypothetical protein
LRDREGRVGKSTTETIYRLSEKWFKFYANTFIITLLAVVGAMAYFYFKTDLVMLTVDTEEFDFLQKAITSINPMITPSLETIKFGIFLNGGAIVLFTIIYVYLFKKFKKDFAKIRMEREQSRDIEDNYTHEVESDVLDGKYDDFDEK